MNGTFTELTNSVAGIQANFTSLEDRVTKLESGSLSIDSAYGSELVKQVAEQLGAAAQVTVDLKAKIHQLEMESRMLSDQFVFSGQSNLQKNWKYPSALYKLRQSIIKKYPAINKRSVWIASSFVCVRLKDKTEPVEVYLSTDLESFQDLSA
ncbi:hypothetical protein KQX54_006554 [Cotesia glomerata]|uniref:Uncharacterized protein n=1 Tax=Cotesia glomerata TaxID=32391 RepID=A0AAV7J392_COTGL|nr:hypothetical protein KQX54_006554 [Cotesia glomerata]